MRNNRMVPIKGRPRYAVVVEGQCEFWYIQMLKRNERAVAVDIKPEIPQRKKLKEQFQRVLELCNTYDKVFWNIDLDVVNNETAQAKAGAKSALQELKHYCATLNEKHKESATVIINNPCLEYWFLLHYEATSKYYNECERATKQLSAWLKDYEKTERYYTKQNNDIYLKLKQYILIAANNASNLSNFDFNNPHSALTQLHYILEEVGIIKRIEKKYALETK